MLLAILFGETVSLKSHGYLPHFAVMFADFKELKGTQD
jgi:hypothetical protein